MLLLMWLTSWRAAANERRNFAQIGPAGKATFYGEQ
jgi:hypothetical protein